MVYSSVINRYVFQPRKKDFGLLISILDLTQVGIIINQQSYMYVSCTYHWRQTPAARRGHWRH